MVNDDERMRRNARPSEKNISEKWRSKQLSRVWRKKGKGQEGCTLGILCMWRANLLKVVVEKRSIRRRNIGCQKVEDGLITPSAYKHKNKWEDFSSSACTTNNSLSPIPWLG